jgi:hypothetical protein
MARVNLTRTVALGATRIGAHTGPAIVGNFGGGRFFDYTAYGDTINIAARLEVANKQLGTRIRVSASVAAQVDDSRGRPVGDLVLRRRSEPLCVFEAQRPTPVARCRCAEPAITVSLPACSSFRFRSHSRFAKCLEHKGSGRGGTVDATDLKSVGRDSMRVRLPPPAPKTT